jgi:hypothetical protein
VNQGNDLPKAKDYQHLGKLEPEKEQQAGGDECRPVVEDQYRAGVRVPDVLKLVVDVLLVRRER